MKKIITLLVILFSVSNIFAHYIWLETNDRGNINEKHEVKVYFGEYSYGILEKPNTERFNSVSNFKIWLVKPNGEKQSLKTIAKDDHYVVNFIPNQKGTYTIALDNKDMDVLDYTKYKMSIFKPQYHAKAKVVVGKNEVKKTFSTNSDSIEIIDLNGNGFKQNDEVQFKVLYKGKLLAKNKVEVFIDDLWSKKVYTDKNGIIKFKLPFNKKYTLEVQFEEKTSGKFKGKDYKFIKHNATYCIKI